MPETKAHQNILSYLNKCQQRQTLAHAYAFIGANNIGKTKTLEGFLSEFVSPDIQNHPDINRINPEKDVITIDIIRKARTWLSMTPISTDKKALIISQADKMNTQAQNAFLKILEEPAENTYIFLIINHKDQIFETIYSRIVPIYFAGKRAKQENVDSELIEKIILTSDISERMRLWTQEKIDKEKIHEWLARSIPVLRKNLIAKKSKSTAKAMQDLLEKLANPKSQNWLLTAENLIISI